MLDLDIFVIVVVGIVTDEIKRKLQTIFLLDFFLYLLFEKIKNANKYLIDSSVLLKLNFGLI